MNTSCADSAPSSDCRPRLALFDLDHTLLPLDSDYEWGQFTAREGLVDGAAYTRRNAEFFEQYRAGTLDLHAYILFATEAIRKLGPQAAHAARERFLRDVIAPAIQAPALALLEQHRSQGDTLVIVTATNEFITRPIAARLGVEHLLAVQLQRDDSGWYNGLIDGVPTLREGKVHRVQAWLSERGLDWPQVHTTFYSDSTNDLALLEKVDVPVATNPDPHLRQLARSRGWQVLDLFEPSPETIGDLPT